MARILVINPNSSANVTRQIDIALGALRRDGGPDIDVVGLPDGPPGIQSQVHIEAVVQPLLHRVRQEHADAYVIACFSDPGLYAARESTQMPVLGIAECAVLSALQRGSRFGVISILNNSIPRHLRYFGAMGVMNRFAGDRAIGMGVAELADENKTFERMRKAAIDLRDIDGADVLIMGCAGMAQQRQRLADDIGLPVIEPTQAAVSAAIGAIALGW